MLCSVQPLYVVIHSVTVSDLFIVCSAPLLCVVIHSVTVRALFILYSASLPRIVIHTVNFHMVLYSSLSDGGRDV